MVSEAKKAYMKTYYQNNKDKLRQNSNEKITCECGSVVSKSHFGRHTKTKIHINYIECKQVEHEEPESESEEEPESESEEEPESFEVELLLSTISKLKEKNLLMVKMINELSEQNYNLRFNTGI